MAQPRDDLETAARLDRAEALAARLDRPMGVLGLVFVFVVLGQMLATRPGLLTFLSVLGWLFWGIFVAEFLLRAYIARFQRRFWKRNWWQIIFLLVPFLRFFRALQALRVLRAARLARFGSVLSAGIRGGRSAGRLLSSRIGWLAAVTAMVIMVSSQLLYVSGSYQRYGDALHQAAMSTVTGSELTAAGGFARLLEVLLAVYSVAVFATLAGAVGAFFLRGSSAEERATLQSGDGS
ncbi:ion transporter [Arthrobacter crystallopoietes]|uniref:ion transporter n=1 Tax=Crystallibacter crystallopoietes TaxID=37928 RepID=UPI0011111469|nr:ion transporter [Arthrobacter crystallopoietes]